jgi:hypothetical protein
MKDESELLKKWTLNASVPAHFNAAVWRKIEERRRASILETMRLWINKIFTRLAVALGYLSLAVAFGLTLAEVQASKLLRERRGQLQAVYLRSLDP